ncbi:MFS transporter [Actinokineospora globicatena]|uniref:MFS transporter n=1 Tax=Actinokineospora globicatena TaxID=103729 RepID=UPI0020A57BD7|nr:MFS transporter [Actinokineospora globicatena]MCP2302295.1 putative arabinose efflux permease, MFS family [Actinokineospora globicatena]GLW76038.1 MFS transporter [Actinokineospora globicatena]GLW82874.1 MFS transporter [Actinokineospora globicatena]
MGVFGRFWLADAISMFGTYVTTVAVQVIAVVALSASATEVGVLNAARWLPYLLFGLIAGVIVDRCRRRPMMIGTDLGRAVLLAVIPLLAVFDQLSFPVLVAVVFGVGALSLFGDAAFQSFLPRIVDRERLSWANVRIEQTAAVAQTTGPLLGSGLIKVLGAPMAVLADAVSYAVSGLLVATLRVEETKPDPAERHILTELREGLRWVYRHRMLAPLAVSSHARFLFTAMASTAFVPFAVHTVGPTGLGLAYAAAGVGTVAGGAVSLRLHRRLGLAKTIVLGRLLAAGGFLLLVTGDWAVYGGQLLLGLGLGFEGPHDVTYRQRVTPDRLQGRCNATIRSFNWGMITIGAPLGGLIGDLVSLHAAMIVGSTGMAIAALALLATPFRTAD